jgi:hypothetical protein
MPGRPVAGAVDDEDLDRVQHAGAGDVDDVRALICALDGLLGEATGERPTVE